jgi:acyl-coenzyme A thioesterase PaaI-like protein
VSGERRGEDEGDAALRRRERASRRVEPAYVEEQPEWRALAEAIRRQIEACVELDAPRDVLKGLVERAEALAADLEAQAHGKRIGLVDPTHVGHEVMHTLPFSPIMGRLNPASHGIEIRTDGERVFCETRLGEVAEGATGLVHGGVIAAIYDEVLAAANMCRSTGGPTGRLTIHYRRPTPLHDVLRFEAWVDRIEGRKVRTLGRCLVHGEVVTEAEGIFVLFTPERRGIEWHMEGEPEGR